MYHFYFSYLLLRCFRQMNVVVGLFGHSGQGPREVCLTTSCRSNDIRTPLSCLERPTKVFVVVCEQPAGSPLVAGHGLAWSVVTPYMQSPRWPEPMTLSRVHCWPSEKEEGETKDPFNVDTSYSGLLDRSTGIAAQVTPKVELSLCLIPPLMAVPKGNKMRAAADSSMPCG
jgi:hypothetical protein